MVKFARPLVNGSVRQHDGAFHAVLEFTHISRPLIGTKSFHRIGGDFDCAAPVFDREMVDVMIDERRDVLAPTA